MSSPNDKSHIKLEKLQKKNAEVADESVESTRRMFAYVAKSNEAGISTARHLNEQSEQLNRVEKVNDHIHDDMQEADEKLKSMQNCFARCMQALKVVSANDGSDNAWQNKDDETVVINQPQSANADRQERGVVRQPPKSGYIKRITNDAREDEMEENLGQVSSMMGNLREMAVNMGSELDRQNEQIDRINAKGDANSSQIDGANQLAKNILKK
ncbi:synaptosomal-associated protein 25 [Stomoxys calcitrans]|uniref:synaptosomal-associated protein 25 n=1 Tax=Stomoxys calcitrans TaxID=35570 RepID=UPI0027E2CF89|nr:synaptosomal-associated protein 25 [Stomoxys calcitrans]